MRRPCTWALIVGLALVPAHAWAQEQDEPTVGEDAEAEHEEEAAPDEVDAEGEGDDPEPEDAEPEPEPEEDPPEVRQAQERIDRGVSLLSESDYDAALAEFEAAYDLVGDHPIRFQLLYNIGQAHELRFRYDLAIAYYQRFLDEGGRETSLRADVEAKLRTLEGLLATLAISSNVPAEVWVDDRHVGDAPGEVLITGGLHIVELRAEGHTDARAEVQIAPREERALSFELEALAEEYRGVSSVFFWSSAGVAVASLVAGTVLGVVALAERGSLDALVDDPVDRYDTDRVEAQQARIQNLALAADVLFGSAVLFGATAIVLALFTDWGEGVERDDGRATRLRVRPVVGVDAGGAFLEGSF